VFVLVVDWKANAISSSSSNDLVEYINSGNFGWKAVQNNYFNNKDVSSIKKSLGYLKLLPRPPPSQRKSFPESMLSSVPVAFDARTQWPGCIGAVRDQGRCGSCWAFGGVEALSDRFCIRSNGSIKVELAPLDPTTCDHDDEGCNGGDPLSLWQYAKRDGIVMESCAPYNDSIATCAPEKEPCLNFVPTPACKKQCKDGSSWSSSKHFAESAYSVSSKVEDIQTEIMTNGPVEGGFSVYADFVHYKSGVYKHVTGQLLGGHAIKIIGWGVDNTSTPYWTVQNSWTSYWGDQGYFLILRGKDECGIEDDICAGLAKI